CEAGAERDRVRSRGCGLGFGRHKTLCPILQFLQKSGDKAVFRCFISFAAAEYRMALKPLVANHPLRQRAALQDFVLGLVKLAAVIIIARVLPSISKL